MNGAQLTVTGLRASYGELEALHGISLRVDPGETVVLLGANGAGKTTTLRAISGMVDVEGSIELDGVPIAGRSPEAVARLGVAHVPQGRGTFTTMTVEENLRLGGITRWSRGTDAEIDRWLTHFPRLRERRRQPAGVLSGGEQQMLAVARAFMMRPRLLLLDEPSLGLAPLVVAEVFGVLAELRAETTTSVLIVEQNAAIALEHADRGYVLEAGEVTTAGTAERLRDEDLIRKAYLGQ